MITYLGVQPGDEKEGGEDDDAKGRQGQEAQAPLQVEGEGASSERRGDSRHCQLYSIFTLLVLWMISLVGFSDFQILILYFFCIMYFFRTQRSTYFHFHL